MFSSRICSARVAAPLVRLHMLTHSIFELMAIDQISFSGLTRDSQQQLLDPTIFQFCSLDFAVAVYIRTHGCWWQVDLEANLNMLISAAQDGCMETIDSGIRFSFWYYRNHHCLLWNWRQVKNCLLQPFCLGENCIVVCQVILNPKTFEVPEFNQSPSEM